MSTHQQHGSPARREPVSEHLHVRPDTAGPAEVHFLFEQREKRLGGALGASVLAHGALVGVYFLIAWLMPTQVRDAMLPDLFPTDIVWLAQPGPGGGGGGGNQQPEPPKKAELPGEEEITVPAVEEPKPEPEPEEPPQQLNIPAQTMAAATQTAPGVIQSDSASTSTGSGIGTGGGEGQGSGLGPGLGGGVGGGVYRPGSGIQLPRIVREVKPQYTAEAMRAKVQGVVLLECVVLATGSVGNCDLVRSLDPVFGLDQEAVRAAKQWQFQPGTRFGEPVNVLVTIELTFTLR